MIVFIHGLNTFGDDLLHVGPLTFGLMHSRLEAEFRKRDVDFVGVLGQGAGSPEEQAEKCLLFLASTGLLSGDSGLVLLGQSIGGIVARVLAARPTLKNRIRAVVTLGTPHAGTNVSDFALKFDENHPTLHKLACQFGYDTTAKAASFRHYTPEAMTRFNERYPAQIDVPEYSLICEVDWAAISLPLRALYKRIHPPAHEGSLPKSDGFIWTASQARGRIVGPFALDHFAALGACFHLSPSARKSARLEFERMIEAVCEIHVDVLK